MSEICCSIFYYCIDGTVASVYVSGDPTKSLKQFQDVDVDHDHSYYGLGCASSSDIPCTTRIVQTFDGENQKNGVYYTFQAAASGSGGKSLSDDNTNSPDTFCPLGWQLPYSGTGGDYYDKSRSWNKLFTTYAIVFNSAGYSEDTKIRAYPFSYIYSGFYIWGTGDLKSQSSTGNYWSETSTSSAGSGSLSIWSSTILASYDRNKADGYPLRCVKFLASHHRRHGGRRPCRFDYLHRYKLFTRSYILWQRM